MPNENCVSLLADIAERANEVIPMEHFRKAGQLSPPVDGDFRASGISRHYLLRNDIKVSDYVDDGNSHYEPKYGAEPPLPPLGAVKLHDDRKPDDACRRENRGIRSRNDVL